MKPTIRAADRLERIPVCGYHRVLLVVIGLAFFFDNLDLAMMTYLLGSIKAEFGLTSAQAGMRRLRFMSVKPMQADARRFRKLKA